jgi:hypothetical protein
LSLTAPERETVITFSDENETAVVHTHQRKVITKLRNNPAATEVEDLSFDGTAGAVFELPGWAISFLSKKRKGGAGNVENPCHGQGAQRTWSRVHEIERRSCLMTRFEIPADLISFRSNRRKLSPEQARAAAANLGRVRQAG